MNYCEWLHIHLESLPLFKYPINYMELPDNGIYIFYEEGEFCTFGNKKYKKIVRVGTHRADGNFKSRIKSHYNGNKNSSVFRMHLGGALVYRENPDDNRLDRWLTQNAPTFEEIECKVSLELKKRFSFRCFPVADKRERMRLEEELIAVLSSCPECTPSKYWLGCYAKREKIRRSGLWNCQHVNSKNVLTEKSVDRINFLSTMDSSKKKALFLIPCCKRKMPGGDSPSWTEVHINQKDNSFQFLDRIRTKLIDFYSSLDENEGFDYYCRFDSDPDKKVEKRRMAWGKTWSIFESKTWKAIDRYSFGKLYSELNPDVLDRLRNGEIDNVFIVSALMGFLSTTDLIPDYELMMTDKSPDNDKVFNFWRKNLVNWHFNSQKW